MSAAKEECQIRVRRPRKCKDSRNVKEAPAVCDSKERCMDMVDTRRRLARLRDSKALPAGGHPQRARLTLPSCLRLADLPPHGVGVFAAAPLPRGVCMGPYKGRLVRADNAGADGYSWRLCDGRLVDASDEAHSNWMRFVNCAPHAAHRNLAGFQYRGALYFRTVASVAIGEELLVDYGDDCMRNVDADGCYDYCPPMEDPVPELNATDRAAGDYAGDCCDYGLPKEEPKSECIDIYYHPLKEEPEFCGGDWDAGDNVRNVDVDGYCDYGLLKEEPKPEPAAMFCGGGHEHGGNTCNIRVDGCYDRDPPKEEPEPKVGGGDGYACDSNDHSDYGPPKVKLEPELASTDGGSGVGGGDDCYNPPKGEPEPDRGGGHGSDDDDRDLRKPEPQPELPATGGDAVTDGGRDDSDDFFDCGANLCTKEFKAKQEFRFKVETQRRELELQITKLYHCAYCRCPFISKQHKEQHQRRYCRKRPVVKRKESNHTYFECNKCEFVTKWKKYFEIHVSKHNKNTAERFTCAQCSYKTSDKHCMTRHMKIHSNTFSYCCSICGKSFRTKPSLDDHLLRRHSDESEEVSKLITSTIYTCNICNKYTTKSKTNFNDHLAVTHLKGVGRQKYECPRCPYSTFRSYSLKTHSRTHLEQKDYQCIGCKKWFTQKRGLDSHILSYHADDVDLVKTITTKIHHCKLCSFKTVVGMHLKDHIRSMHT